VTMWNCCCSDS